MRRHKCRHKAGKTQRNSKGYYKAMLVGWLIIVKSNEFMNSGCEHGMKGKDFVFSMTKGDLFYIYNVQGTARFRLKTGALTLTLLGNEMEQTSDQHLTPVHSSIQALRQCVAPCVPTSLRPCFQPLTRPGGVSKVPILSNPLHVTQTEFNEYWVALPRPPHRLFFLYSQALPSPQHPHPPTDHHTRFYALLASSALVIPQTVGP